MLNNLISVLNDTQTAPAYEHAGVKCGRTACPTILGGTHGYVRIQNQLVTLGSWGEYCVRCARRILEAGWMPNEVYDKRVGGFRPWISKPQDEMDKV